MVFLLCGDLLAVFSVPSSAFDLAISQVSPAVMCAAFVSLPLFPFGAAASNLDA